MNAKTEEIARRLEALGRAMSQSNVAIAIKYRVLPIPWPDFCRYCWRVYGTGRTEPDE